MTEEEFDTLLSSWASSVHAHAASTLASQTHSSGLLGRSLTDFVDRMRDNVGRHIAWRFEQYGVFRQYGAGRGWIVINGKPVPGRRIMSLRSIRDGSWKKSAAYRALKKDGWRNKQIRDAKVTSERSSTRERTPLDWLDGKIAAGAPQLASIAQEFFGDMALRSLDQAIVKAKIIK